MCIRDSAGTAFHSPAFSAATPMIVPKEELTKCAGYTQTMQAVSAIISPAAAAFLYAVWPLNAIILLDIVGAILACVTVAISSIPTPELCPETKRQQFLQDMNCLLYTSPSPRDRQKSRMPSSA